MGGHKEKTSPRGVKNPVLCPRGGKENTRFCPGVEKITILSEGVTENFLPSSCFLME